MPEPISKIRSKLARAVTAFLISVGGDCGTKDDIFPANTAGDKEYPNTTVRATTSTPEVTNTGLRRVRLQIEVKGQPSGAPSAANDDQDRKAFDDRVGATQDTLLLSDDGVTLQFTARAITAAGRALAASADPKIAAANADMADFTCSDLFEMGEGEALPIENGPAWHEVLLFDALCSPSNTD